MSNTSVVAATKPACATAFATRVSMKTFWRHSRCDRYTRESCLKGPTPMRVGGKLSCYRKVGIEACPSDPAHIERAMHRTSVSTEWSKSVQCNPRSFGRHPTQRVVNRHSAALSLNVAPRSERHGSCSHLHFWRRSPLSGITAFLRLSSPEVPQWTL